MDKSYLETLDIRGRVERNPYQSLLIAAGIGYVLGGGLFTRLTMNALRLGLRVGAIPILQRELVGVAEAALGARPPDSSAS